MPSPSGLSLQIGPLRAASAAVSCTSWKQGTTSLLQWPVTPSAVVNLIWETLLTNHSCWHSCQQELLQDFCRWPMMFCLLFLAVTHDWHDDGTSALVVLLMTSISTHAVCHKSDDFLAHIVICSHHDALVQWGTTVPQGSAIGPVLYLIFINNTVSGLSSRLALFADDAHLCLALPTAAQEPAWHYRVPYHHCTTGASHGVFHFQKQMCPHPFFLI